MFSKINEAILSLMARFEREDGQALAEYCLILALIAAVSVIALTALGVAVSGLLDGLAGDITP